MWNIGSLSFERLHAPVRGAERFCIGAKFSFACQKRTRKAPAISTRWIHEKGAARPFQTPKGKSKPKNASRFAKRIFWASPVYGSADGVTLSQDFTFSKGVKSAAKQQIGETRKKRLAKRLAFFRFDLIFGIVKGVQPLTRCGESGVQR
jgi:hypothetical protein